jgi:hypothetical protein
MESTQMLACTQALDTSLEHEEATHKRLVSPNVPYEKKTYLDCTLQSRRVHYSEPKPWRYVENVTYGTYLVVDVMFDFVYIHKCNSKYQTKIQSFEMYLTSLPSAVGYGTVLVLVPDLVNKCTKCKSSTIRYF